MKVILKYISDTFDMHVLSLFLFSSIFLLFFDYREYKKKGYEKEYKFTRFFGIFYAFLGLGMYVFARLIKM